MSKTKKARLEVKNFIYTLIAISILLLSAFNLRSNKQEIQVLGAQVEDNQKYWEELVKKHPTYIEGWLELGRLDKVREIDPNYLR